MAGIIINEDFENFMASRPMDKMTEAGLKEQIDNYARIKLLLLLVFSSAMFLNLCGKTWRNCPTDA